MFNIFAAAPRDERGNRLPHVGPLSAPAYVEYLDGHASWRAINRVGMPQVLEQRFEWAPRPEDLAEKTWGAQAEEVNFWFPLFQEALELLQVFYRGYSRWFYGDEIPTYQQELARLSRCLQEEDFFEALTSVLRLHWQAVGVAERVPKKVPFYN